MLRIAPKTSDMKQPCFTEGQLEKKPVDGDHIAEMLLEPRLLPTLAA